MHFLKVCQLFYILNVFDDIFFLIFQNLKVVDTLLDILYWIFLKGVLQISMFCVISQNYQHFYEKHNHAS